MKSLNSLKPIKFKKCCHSSFKKYFFKLFLKVLRFLVRLCVAGVLFQKVGPIYDKASWSVLVLRNGHLNFKFIVYSDMKDFIQIIRALFIEILNPIKDGLFQGCLRMGGAFWPPLPKIRHTNPTMMKLGSYTLPKEDPKNA